MKIEAAMEFMQQTRILDPLTFPLQGCQLIEASAGTGKTFTLALLYVRLVLGKGEQAQSGAFHRPLMPDEILVVTFTRAAAEELRDRIRKRLLEAAHYFSPEAKAKNAQQDTLLQALRAQFAPSQWPACAKRLRQASERMDQAMIDTIHGWCHRMLQTYAFETRGLFQRELVTNQTALITDIVLDYWRIHFYALSVQQADALVKIIDSPQHLQDLLTDCFTQRYLPLSYQGKPLSCQDDAIDKVLADAVADHKQLQYIDELEQQVRTLWVKHRQAIEAMLLDIRPHLNGTKHNSANAEKFQALLTDIQTWCKEGGKAPTKLTNFAQGRFSFKQKATVQKEPQHLVFDAILQWQTHQNEYATKHEQEAPYRRACVLAHAAAWVKQELDKRLRRRAEMGFDDLLSELLVALDADTPSSQRLREVIRSKLPVALIDEFQDTDPIQYRIFEHIYALHQPNVHQHGTALIMIGDPKQAIYAFRGADIHSYLKARKATLGNHYTLNTNYRSSRALVKACNIFFEFANQHLRGAFHCKTEQDDPIAFQPVKAKGRTSELIINGQLATAFNIWTLDQNIDFINKKDYKLRLASSAASQIVSWLEQALSHRTGFRTANDFIPLRPQDIAILVRDGQEAKAMRDALAARQLNSVYLSDRDSVLASPEAQDILHWLRACATPGEERLVKTALGTNTLAQPLTDLASFNSDEMGWEEKLEAFYSYQRIWKRQGVLAMLHTFIHEHALPTRLLMRHGGERSLTNLLHLAEWLQQASTSLDGEQALIRHLSEQLGTCDDEFTLRLESDAELIKIVTMHKAKGLEYPLVLLPFICNFRETQESGIISYQAESQRYLETAPRQAFEQARQQAEDTRLSEDMRLLYVALTRAQYALWLSVVPLKTGQQQNINLHKSAVGYLLLGGQKFSDTHAITQALHRLKDDHSEISITLAPPATQTQAPAQMSHQNQELEPLRVDFTLTPWWIASYSALQHAHEPHDLAPSQVAMAATALVENLREDLGQALDVTPQLHTEAWASTASKTCAPGLHDFPRGAVYGDFLHGILEWAAQAYTRDEQGQELHGFKAVAYAHTLRTEMLTRRCKQQGLEAWTEQLAQWLAHYLSTPWQLSGLPDQETGLPTCFALQDIPLEQVKVEMEFWFAAHKVDVQAIDDLVTQHCLPGHKRPALLTNKLNGMFKGYIDLILCHQGRYYIIDWKSNYLGPDAFAYTHEAMTRAMLTHRYELQYTLYTLALHRHLRARLPDYDYAKDVGGVIYGFLRGNQSATQGLFTDRPPLPLIQALDQLFAT